MLHIGTEDGRGGIKGDGSGGNSDKKEETANTATTATNLKGTERIIDAAYDALRKRQRPLLNLPPGTADEDSAWGQLRLLGYHCGGDANDNANNNDDEHDKDEMTRLHVVHRLDCETSGVMVFARNRRAASALCASWRLDSTMRAAPSSSPSSSSPSASAAAVEANAALLSRGVDKIYHARVERWPPYHDCNESKGRIDMALAPSQTERIKWEVRNEEEGGRASLTEWRVLLPQLAPTKPLSRNEVEVCREEKKSAETDDVGAGKRIEKDNIQKASKGRDGDGNNDNNSGEGKNKNCDDDNIVTLELRPLTGRTHQLRIHCAAMGSGIVGDSLYGDCPVEFRGGGERGGGGKVSNKDENAGAKTDDDDNNVAAFLHLHAYKLTFPHPTTGEKISFEHPTSWR